jgi:drug/metabolite transporter (DMT)-like permease
MHGIAKVFFASAVVYGLLGMVLGLDMAMRHDHGELPTHAHIMVVGWVSFAIFAFFYHLLGDGVPRWLALAHVWLAQVSTAVMIAGLWLFYGGSTQYEPAAAIGALGYAASFVLFAVAAFMGLRERVA